MIVCPVCEHSQVEEAECEVCGKKLLHGAAAVPYVPPVEGLEPTRLAEVDAAEVPLAELEPTRVSAAAEAPADAVPDLDRGRAAPVEVADELVPDLERVSDRIPGDAPTAVPALVTCRYCRTPAPAGERVCSRCGMRLPVFEVAAPASEGGEAPRLCSCGTPIRGSRCSMCGARVS